MKNYAYITLLSNDGYVDGILLLHHSLQKVNTQYPFYCMVTEDVHELTRKILEGFDINLIPVDKIEMPIHIQKYNEEKEYALAQTWRYCLTKYHIFNMTQFEKIIFLDADLYFQKNVDHVFKYGHMTGAVDGEAFNLWLDNPHLNTGFFVVEPSNQLFNDIMNFANNVDPNFHDWVVADQEILNYYYNEWPEWQEKHLDAMYNVFPPYLVEPWSSEWQIQQIMKNAVFFHFVGTKPWTVEKYVNDGFNFLQNELAIIRQKKREVLDLPKLAIYTICKNEIQEVDEWIKSMWEADYICVLDTGSTDDTYERLLAWQQLYPEKLFVKQEIINPWRFDVARNRSMELIPEDTVICMSTDLDERLVPGWSDDIRFNWNSKVGRMIYKYAWSHNLDGSPARIFWYDKIHSYGKWFWKYPVHEALMPLTNEDYQVVALDENIVYLHHYPKHKENRTSYIDLLKIRVEEDPTDFTSWQYLTHEYYYMGFFEECIDTALNVIIPNLDKLQDPISQPNIYYFIGCSYMNLQDFNNARKYFEKGIKTGDYYRENYLGHARSLMALQRYEEAIETINNGLLKSKRYHNWLERDTTWTWEPYDLLANCYYILGNYTIALDYAELAFSKDNQHENLAKNVATLRQLVK